jgi:hypothetical protein
MVREMRDIPGASPNWTEILLLKMARLHLLIQAYRRLESLPEPSRTDVRTLLGWTINRKELILSSPALSDDWLVVAQTLEEDETSGLRTQINWLWGKTSRKPAQLILFAFRTRPFEDHLFPGLTLRGDLVYFPGAYPLRAVFKPLPGAGIHSCSCWLPEFSRLSRCVFYRARPQPMVRAFSCRVGTCDH